eukprot:GHVP01009886.1.p1 GENE.GHVP01009886.1~~GHVP01009886.1.p1  ORF type:complete len:238 (-),score=40.52 GHVP01009886.1:132-845(-)
MPWMFSGKKESSRTASVDSKPSAQKKIKEKEETAPSSATAEKEETPSRTASMDINVSEGISSGARPKILNSKVSSAACGKEKTEEIESTKSERSLSDVFEGPVPGTGKLLKGGSAVKLMTKEEGDFFKLFLSKAKYEYRNGGEFKLDRHTFFTDFDLSDMTYVFSWCNCSVYLQSRCPNNDFGACGYVKCHKDEEDSDFKKLLQLFPLSWIPKIIPSNRERGKCFCFKEFKKGLELP